MHHHVLVVSALYNNIVADMVANKIKKKLKSGRHGVGHGGQNGDKQRIGHGVCLIEPKLF